ncbi:hypothetical protein CL684_03005 [Candidatus Campbellbacteria bacterium]|nr:hypothetical protein [Candidatus Campbellbacteria bacterium]|tara:strand:- start:106 stop:1029 length:924 start_codon:yes stop_codon:yes gene_type:complete
MSLRLDIQRIIKEGLIKFWRNKLISFSTTLVMTIALLMLSSLMFLNAGLSVAMSQLEDRVDVNIYFFPDVPESEILTLQDRIGTIPEVRDVQYISREEAFVQFQERHQNDELINRSLEELGDNPLGASLNVRAFRSSQYESVVNAIESEPAVSNSDFVERINYYDNKTAIDRLNEFNNVVRAVTVGATIFFVIIALLVILSTMRIAIFASKKEIRIKRLVGAEHRYTRGPFVVMGAFYGFLAAIFTMVTLYFATGWVADFTRTFFGGMDFKTYFTQNIFYIFIIVAAVGVILGVISSYLAIRRYLRT